MNATPMTDRVPISTLEDLDTLDHAEVIDGYNDGRAGAFLERRRRP